MSDYIKREDAMRSLCEYCAVRDTHICEKCEERSRIMDIPAADVVEVVRCVNCKYRNGYSYHCNTKPDNYFCAEGRRREDGDK